MEYDFTGKYPNVEPIVFALCLVCGKGRAKKKERILVGPESDVYAALQGQQRDIYFDGTRPWGKCLWTLKQTLAGSGMWRLCSCGKATANCWR